MLRHLSSHVERKKRKNVGQIVATLTRTARPEIPRAMHRSALLLTLVLSCVVAASAKVGKPPTDLTDAEKTKLQADPGSYSCYGKCDSANAEKSPCGTDRIDTYLGTCNEFKGSYGEATQWGATCPKHVCKEKCAKAGVNGDFHCFTLKTGDKLNLMFADEVSAADMGLSLGCPGSHKMKQKYMAGKGHRDCQGGGPVYKKGEKTARPAADGFDKDKYQKKDASAACKATLERFVCKDIDKSKSKDKCEVNDNCKWSTDNKCVPKTDGSDAVIDENAESKRTDEATVRAQMLKMMTEISGASEADMAAFVDTAEVKPYFEYICTLSTNALLAKNFDFETWKKSCATAYLALFFEGAEDATKKLVDIAHAEYEASKKVFIVEDEEGEDLCKCDFSLAYGALILLNNATLHMKKGKRYGLCGPNGCGKSTLMKAINNGQVDGFPPPEELRTVYVEHDIQGDQHEMSVVEFVLDNDVIKQHGTTAADVEATLLSFQFTERMINGPVVALSGGWKMKLALARAILMKADILLLDEPTNHLDVKNVAWLEEYLCSQNTVSSMIVSHDSGFLDRVCTHIIHYETRKLVTYKGNLTEFIRQCPAAKKYTELSNDELKFIFPVPGFLEGVKNKDKAIVKANNVHFTYPNTDRQIIQGASIQLSLSSRVACLGPNGAGKSTLIKCLTGEVEPQVGTVWKHPNMRYAYVAQHAFHHVEQHLEKTPNEYIRWRFQTGEDKENLTKVTAQYTEEEERLMKEKIPVPQEDGSILKLVVEKIISRRQKKSKYEYEVQWKGLSLDNTSWMEKEKLEKYGFAKYLVRIDEREAARAGLYARPLTQANVEKHLIDFGLDAEFGTHNRIKGLSGGQKVKLVLAAAMWQQPHIVVMDEPTNYLDRDALGALACAVKEFGGGVLLITHSCEFADALKEETWDVPGDGKVYITGNKWGQGKKGSGKGDTVEWTPEEDTVDALGNVVKVKGPKKKLSRKEIKAKAKARAAKLAEGQDLTTDSDWDLDEYIGEQKEKKVKSKD